MWSHICVWILHPVIVVKQNDPSEDQFVSLPNKTKEQDAVHSSEAKVTKSLRSSATSS